MQRLISRLILTGLVLIPFAANADDKPLRDMSPSDAVKAADVCNDTAGERTYRIYINNQSSWGIVIAFVQIKDESGMIPSGFISDTGTFVLATNSDSYTEVAQDPCYAGGYMRPIQGTRCLGSVKMTNGTDEVDVPLPDITDGDVTTYYGVCGWDIANSIVDGKRVPSLVSRTKLSKKSGQ